jgi:hypothetical protein
LCIWSLVRDRRKRLDPLRVRPKEGRRGQKALDCLLNEEMKFALRYGSHVASGLSLSFFSQSCWSTARRKIHFVSTLKRGELRIGTQFIHLDDEVEEGRNKARGWWWWSLVGGCLLSLYRVHANANCRKETKGNIKISYVLPNKRQNQGSRQIHSMTVQAWDVSSIYGLGCRFILLCSVWSVCTQERDNTEKEKVKLFFLKMQNEFDPKSIKCVCCAMSHMVACILFASLSICDSG